MNVYIKELLDRLSLGSVSLSTSFSEREKAEVSYASDRWAVFLWELVKLVGEDFCSSARRAARSRVPDERDVGINRYYPQRYVSKSWRVPGISPADYRRNLN